MPRTTSIAVAGIIEVDASIPLTPFIEAANYLVTEVCAPALDANSDPYYSDPDLELIERWLSAHFYAVRDPRETMVQASTVRQQFESKVDTGLAITRYGQQAMRIDRFGGLAALDNALRTVVGILPTGRRPKSRWLGTSNDVVY